MSDSGFLQSRPSRANRQISWHQLRDSIVQRMRVGVTSSYVSEHRNDDFKRLVMDMDGLIAAACDLATEPLIEMHRALAEAVSGAVKPWLVASQPEPAQPAVPVEPPSYEYGWVGWHDGASEWFWYPGKPPEYEIVEQVRPATQLEKELMALHPANEHGYRSFSPAPAWGPLP